MTQQEFLNHLAEQKKGEKLFFERGWFEKFRIKGLVIKKVDFNGIIFEDVIFDECMFVQCSFNGVIMKDTKFMECSFCSTPFISCSFEGRVGFWYNTFQSCYMKDCFSKKCMRLEDCFFRNSSIFNSTFEELNITGMCAITSNFIHNSFSNCNLRFMTLSFGIFEDNNFYQTSVQIDNCYSSKISNPQPINVPMCAPSEGSFIGWKKCEGNYIVKLLIPEDAKRSSATSHKCRCNKAIVLDIQDIEGNSYPDKVVASCRNQDFKYRVGETIIPDGFCENRFLECASGIHFFVDRAAAVSYSI